MLNLIQILAQRNKVEFIFLFSNVSAFLCVCRYFHSPVEILVGAVFGLILFQVPLLFLSARLLQAHEDEDGDHVD
jgi:hypothetical protein